MVPPHLRRSSPGPEGLPLKASQVDHRHDLAQPGGAEQTTSVFPDPRPGQWLYTAQIAVAMHLVSALYFRCPVMSVGGRYGLIRMHPKRPRFQMAIISPWTPSASFYS